MTRRMILGTQEGQNMQLGFSNGMTAAAVLRTPPFRASDLFAGGRAGYTITATPTNTYSDTGKTTLAAPGDLLAAAVAPVSGMPDVVQSSAPDRPVFVRRPAVGARNLSTYSREIGRDFTSWQSPVGGTVVTKSADGFDGAANRGTVWTENADAGVQHVVGVSGGFTAETGQQVVFSYYFRRLVGNRHPALLFQSGSAFGTIPTMWVNLDTGVITQSGGVNRSAGAEDLGDGWWRVWLSAEVQVGGGPFGPRVGVTNGAGGSFGVYDGDGTSSVVVDGAQFEIGSVPTALQTSETLFDVTQSGQRSVYRWAANGVNQWAATASAVDMSGATSRVIIAGITDLGGNATLRFVTHGAAVGGAEILKNASDEWRGIYNDGASKTVDGTVTPRAAVVELFIERSGNAELLLNGVSQGTVAVGAQAFDNDPLSLFGNITGGALTNAEISGVTDLADPTPAERARLRAYHAHQHGEITL